MPAISPCPHSASALTAGASFSPALVPKICAQASASGRRLGHYQAFLNLLRHAYLWNAAREHYGDIEVPVLVVYGDHDWSRPDERQRTVAAIPMAKIETVPDGGHFLSLDRPQRLAEMIMSFAKG